jgi:ATP-dependent exoDNAse (exonuclease V) beta subunit
MIDDGVEKTLDMFGKHLEFEEESHTYTYQGEEMTSVTTLLKEYFPFDEEAAAQGCLDRGLPPYDKCGTTQDVKDIWEAKAQFGTDVHQLCEDYLNGKFVSMTNDRERRAFNYVSKLKFEKALPEVRVVAPEWGISGMVDLLIRRDGKYYIMDWKTDKAIRKKGWNDAKCAGVLAEFDNCNFNKFAFQLGIYKVILEHVYDIQIHGLMVVHFSEHRTTEYPLPFHKEYIGLVIKKFIESKENE